MTAQMGCLVSIQGELFSRQGQELFRADNPVICNYQKLRSYYKLGLQGSHQQNIILICFLYTGPVAHVAILFSVTCVVLTSSELEEDITEFQSYFELSSTCSPRVVPETSPS